MGLNALGENAVKNTNTNTSQNHIALGRRVSTSAEDISMEENQENQGIDINININLDELNSKQGTTQGNGRSLKMTEIDETDASKIKRFSQFFTELFGAMNNQTN